MAKKEEGISEKAVSRPILFSGEMVRAILEGRKTQTRRVVKGTAVDMLGEGFTPTYVASSGNAAWCPYGQAGDRLWVREMANLAFIDDDCLALHYATAPELEVRFNRAEAGPYKFVKWTPSIHMPRWASRLTLEITTVRVERVQEISGFDIGAEGIEMVGNYRARWRELWDKINAERGFGWDVNPWVWVVEFKRTDQ